MINRMMIPSIRNVLVFILLFINAGYDLHANDAKTEILWDNYGVPHIYAQNSRDMYYAFGWAQMNNHANLMLKLYAQARGCAAEYWGIKYAESDKQILLFKIPELARTGYLKQNPEYKSYLDAFVTGINDFASAHPEKIGEEFRQVLPVTAYDIISHTIRIICLEFLAGEDIGTVKRITAPGSNAIAIAPSKSASKNSMLITNPHLPWADYFIWFEAHLNAPGFTAYGIALVGMPSITMAFNDNLGWALTVNPIDASDRYELDLKEDGYVLDKKVIPFERKQISIRVRQDDGSLKDQSVEFKYSKHGPVVGEKGNKAYAVRIAGLTNYRIFEQYHKMARSKNLAEFESAVKMLQNPMFNIIYADKAGNILYVFNGNIPIRKEGDFAFWRGTIDGKDSKYIWQEIHHYEDLPKLLNPASGFLQNCNDPPWTCTDPPVLNPQDYPSYFAPVGTFMRPQRAVNMIKNNPTVSFEQLVACKLNTGMEIADRFLNDLLKAVDKYPDTAAVRAAAVLRLWDKKTEKDSRGAVLFARWWDLVNSSMFETAWNAKEPNTTPSGIKDQKLAVDLLVKAACAVRGKYGSLNVAWGEVNRFRMYGLDYPANGGPGDYGIFRTVYFAEDSDNKMKAIAGETYVAVTEFGKKVKARVLLSYGNATQPGSKHLGDQLIMLSEKKLRPALMEKAEILKNLEKRETLNPGSKN